MKVAVVGFGNILRKDDGFGVYVVNFLKENYRFEPQINLIDAGICSFKLIDHLVEYDFLIIVDIVSISGKPGDVIKLDTKQIKNTFNRLGHDFDVSGIIDFLDHDKVLVVATIPQDCDSYEIGLSEKVIDGFHKIVKVILDELNSLGINFYQTDNKTIQEVIEQFGS